VTLTTGKYFYNKLSAFAQYLDVKAACVNAALGYKVNVLWLHNWLW